MAGFIEFPNGHELESGIGGEIISEVVRYATSAIAQLAKNVEQQSEGEKPSTYLAPAMNFTMEHGRQKAEYDKILHRYNIGKRVSTNKIRSLLSRIQRLKDGIEIYNPETPGEPPFQIGFDYRIFMSKFLYATFQGCFSSIFFISVFQSCFSFFAALLTGLFTHLVNYRDTFLPLAPPLEHHPQIQTTCAPNA